MHGITDNDRDFIAARGPDSVKEFSLTLGKVDIFGVSSVLHMRGPQTVPQPLESSRFILQWNGEIFDFSSDYAGIDGENNDVSLDGNDTELLFEHISALEADDEDLSPRLGALLDKIQGPWAIVLLDKLHKRVYFGRDCFGRRSLLYRVNDGVNGDGFHLLIASSSAQSDMIECKAGLLYRINFNNTDSIDSSMPVIATAPFAMTEWTITSKFPIEDSAALLTRAWSEFELSVSKRILHLPSDKGISILFSGGVDSMLIAVACGRILTRENVRSPSISLINVAFEHPGLLKQLRLTAPCPEYWSAIPDRQSGQEGFQELCRLFPDIKFSFIECNVSRAEYDRSRPRIRQLMAPNDTVMDLSLAMVIWHGSQGARRSQAELAAKCKSSGKSNDDDHSAVLLCGMGADEQFGGYSRHRSLHSSPASLQAELQLDLNRISTRNLGRDDRCIGDAGLEGRFPFLDERFVRFVCEQVPLQGKLDKWLVREMLREAGVGGSLSGKPKRAMQFGAKSAKIESTQCSGTDKV